MGVVQFIYRTRAIISRGLYFFYSFFTKAAAYTADNLCTKQGNVGLKSAAYKWEQLQIKSGLWWRAYGMQSWIHGHYLNKMPRTLHGEMPLLLTKTNFSWHFRLKPHNLWTLMGVVQVIYAVMDSSFTHAHHSIKMPRTLHGMHGT